MANLILYFSRAGENYWNGSLKTIPKGNTQRVAEYIQRAVGGDLFEIRPAKPYPEGYYDCAARAKEEQQTKARPELMQVLSDISKYDVIFVGYPNWWGTCPMPVFTLLERLDFTGKKLLPFCTNEGSGLGQSEQDLKKSCKGARFGPGLSLHGAGAESAEARVAAWARQNV